MAGSKPDYGARKLSTAKHKPESAPLPRGLASSPFLEKRFVDISLLDMTKEEIEKVVRHVSSTAGNACAFKIYEKKNILISGNKTAVEDFEYRLKAALLDLMKKEIERIKAVPVSFTMKEDIFGLIQMKGLISDLQIQYNVRIAYIDGDIVLKGDTVAVQEAKTSIRECADGLLKREVEVMAGLSLFLETEHGKKTINERLRVDNICAIIKGSSDCKIQIICVVEEDVSALRTFFALGFREQFVHLEEKKDILKTETFMNFIATLMKKYIVSIYVDQSAVKLTGTDGHVLLVKDELMDYLSQHKIIEENVTLDKGRGKLLSVFARAKIADLEESLKKQYESIKLVLEKKQIIVRGTVEAVSSAMEKLENILKAIVSERVCFSKFGMAGLFDKELVKGCRSGIEKDLSVVIVDVGEDSASNHDSIDGLQKGPATSSSMKVQMVIGSIADQEVS